ncbi:MAG: 50S ribosomal protein L10 [Desulfovibrionaceae bacterium]
MNRTEKAIVVEDLKRVSEAASVALVTSFKGMQVEESTRLRASVRNAGGSYIVVKNTLANIALMNGKHAVLQSALKEDSAIVFAIEDVISVVKVLADFSKESKFLEIRLGSLDGQVLSSDDIKELAKLPSREVLLATALGTLNSVPGNFVSLFANLIRGMLYGLKAIEEQKRTQ